MSDLAISGTTLAICSAATFALVVALILIFKHYIRKRSEQLLAKEQSPSRLLPIKNKYLEVNVFRWSSTFLNVGLLLAVALVFLAFSWTTYEKQVDISDKYWDEEDLVVEIPRTTTPPPPPPPPPPPVIEAVPEEEIEEEEEIEFMDQLVEEDTEVVPPPAPIKKVAPPPPPPPPPVVEDEITNFILIEDKPLFQECEGVKRAEQEKCFTDHLLKYVYGEVNYPAIARENGIEGNVFIKFVIEKTGKVGTIDILRSPSEILSKETVRVMEKLKREVTFIPGMQRKRPVRVQFTMPVKYKLN
ncbi:MAG: energy transducer TonB [Bacteroidota bacterium]